MTDWLWTAGEAAAATEGRAEGEWQGVDGLSIDTRELVSGDLFIALQGENRDGHAFVAQALAAGAGAAMVTHRPDEVADDAPLLVVDDTLKALERLGIAARSRTQAKVIAVTGSVGKTSTKEMLRTMLEGQGLTHAATRSFNNHWGVPLTLARMPEQTDFAVLEIGMNHPGEIVPLSRMARPDVAMITTVAAVHMAAFDSVEQIADAKAEIFAGLGPEGIAVLNADNEHFARLAAAAGEHPIRSFGAAKGANLKLIEAVQSADAMVVRAEIDASPVTFKIGAPGEHFVLNALGALGCVEAVGADLARAALALAQWSPPSGRGSRAEIALGPGGMDGAITLLDESYNANPTSMRAALAVLAAADVTHDVGRVAKGRRLAFLGDMLELGPEETALHAGLAALPEVENIDRIHCCGPRMKVLHDALPPEKRGLYCADSQELAQMLPRVVDAGDVCMVKGSLGARMARVVEAIKRLGTEKPGPADEDE